MAVKKNLRTEYEVMEYYGMMEYVMMDVLGEGKQRDNVRRRVWEVLLMTRLRWLL